MSERRNAGLLALVITGCLTLAIGGTLAVLGIQRGHFKHPAAVSEKSPGGIPAGARPLALAIDVEASHVGDVVSLTGEAHIGTANRLVLIKKFSSRDALVVVCLDDPPPAAQGHIRLTGTVRGKPFDRDFRMLLLEKCTVSRP